MRIAKIKPTSTATKLEGQMNYQQEFRIAGGSVYNSNKRRNAPCIHCCFAWIHANFP